MKKQLDTRTSEELIQAGEAEITMLEAELAKKRRKTYALKNKERKSVLAEKVGKAYLVVYPERYQLTRINNITTTGRTQCYEVDQMSISKSSSAIYEQRKQRAYETSHFGKEISIELYNRIVFNTQRTLSSLYNKTMEYHGESLEEFA